MIRAVLDTNLIVSGLFWRGNPAQAIDAARVGGFSLISSEALIAELVDVLSRPKFVKDFARIGETVESFLENDYRLLAQVIDAPQMSGIVTNDPDDDAVVACAVAGQASYIVTGDQHLLSLGRYKNIEIITVAQFVTEVLSQPEK